MEDAKKAYSGGDSEKTTPGWNQEVKEAIEAKKNAFKTLLQDRWWSGPT